MTLDELMDWRRQHADEITRFLHHHRELAGIHFMTQPNDPSDAHVELTLKMEGDTTQLESDAAQAFPGIPVHIEVLDPEQDFGV